jgi:hypothetical protein
MDKVPFHGLLLFSMASNSPRVFSLIELRIAIANTSTSSQTSVFLHSTAQGTYSRELLKMRSNKEL